MSLIPIKDAARQGKVSLSRLRLMCLDGCKGTKLDSDFYVDSDILQSALPSREDRFTREELCRIFSVSPAAVNKWIRSGKISAEPDGDETDALLAETESGGFLRSRRNKRFIAGCAEYSCYLDDAESAALADIVAERFPSPPENTLRSVLCELALRLMHGRGMLLCGEAEEYLPLYLQNNEIAACYAPLLRGLLGNEPELSVLSGLEDIYPDPPDGADFLGTAYISMTDMTHRRAKGVFFTPPALVNTALGQIPEYMGGSCCDPCCGSGAFLMSFAAHGAKLCDIYGFDIDEICVRIARLNLAILLRPDDISPLLENIRVYDSSDKPTEKRFDLIATNPPWGVRIMRGGKSHDSCGLHTAAAAEMLADDASLALILPEAVFSAGAHRDIRSILTEKLSLRALEYSEIRFDGVNCPCVVVCAQKSEKKLPARITAQGKSFSALPRPEGYSMLLTDDELSLLRQMEERGSFSLKKHADFALGIVTGDNRRLVSDVPFEGSEPILRGTDVFPYRCAEPASHIRFLPDSFQQCAPEELYRAPLKLVYRFIGKMPVFAADMQGYLTLNSCNLLIPMPDGMSVFTLLAILNSSAARFYISARYRSAKLLRKHIESLPIAAADKNTALYLEQLARAIAEGNSGLIREADEAVSALYGFGNAEKTILTEWNRNYFRYGPDTV